MNNDHDNMIKQFESIRAKTQMDIDVHKTVRDKILNNTTIALMYIEAESDMIHEYAKTAIGNKNEVIIDHIERNIGRFDRNIVRKAIRKQLGYFFGGILFAVLIAVVVLAVIIDCVYN